MKTNDVPVRNKQQQKKKKYYDFNIQIQLYLFVMYVIILVPRDTQTFVCVCHLHLSNWYNSNGVICKIGKIAKIYFSTIHSTIHITHSIHTIEIVFDV